MKITVENLVNEFWGISAQMPQNIIDSFPTIEKNIRFYGKSEKIDAVVDRFVDTVNTNLKTGKKTSTRRVSKSKEKTTEASPIEKEPETEPLPQPDPEEPAGNPESGTRKTKARKTAKDTAVRVIEFPAELELIKRFCNLQGKVKSKTEIYAYIKKLQKAITEKKVRKHNVHARHIEDIQHFMISLYNKMQSGTKKIEIKEHWYNELKKISNMKWADHIVVIRKYINIHNSTQKGVKEKARELLTKIEKSTFSEKGKEYISSIRDSLQDYLSGKTDQLVMTRFALEGLYGISGLSGLGNLPQGNTGFNAPIPASELVRMDFKTIKLTGKWKELIGEPSDPFRVMIWGKKGQGKSTLAIEFARYLQSVFRKRILYVASEEGISHVLKDKFIRLKADFPNILVHHELPTNLVEYDCIFLDSVNTLNIKLQDFTATMKKYPHISWCLMFQSLKDGDFRGDNQWPHLVDAVIQCNEGKASTPEKNRYGGKGIVDVTFEEGQRTV